MEMQFYRDDNNMICVVGTTYSFDDEEYFREFAEQQGWEIEEVEAPEEIDYTGLVW